MKTTKLIANGLLILGLAAVAAAQATPAPGDKPDEGTRGEWKRPDVVGQITAINGRIFTIKNREGHDVTVTLTDSTKLMKDRKPSKIADYKIGDMAMVRGHSTGTDTWEAEFLGSRSGGAEGGPGGGPGGFGQGGFGQGMGTKFIAGEIKSIDGTHLTIARPDADHRRR